MGVRREPGGGGFVVVETRQQWRYGKVVLGGRW